MKELKLTDYQLIHNSGNDLWDYIFENGYLKHNGPEIDGTEDDWYDEGISWITDNLLDGEVFEIFEDNETYAYTSMGRHANIKKKEFRKLNLQGNSIAANKQGGAFSMTKMVKSRWNIDLDYVKLPKEVRDGVHTKNASVRIKEWIKDNE